MSGDDDDLDDDAPGGRLREAVSPGASEGARHTVTVAAAQANLRLDRALAALMPGISRARLQALLEAGHVHGPSGVERAASRRVADGEVLTIDLPPPAPAEPEGEAIALDIRHEDDHLVVVNKPAGLVVHPAAGHARGTLVNALIAHCGASLSGIGGVRRPGIVHRLDKDTSGLLVVAKTDAAHLGLSAQFASHGADGRLVREYQALAWGSLGRPKMTIDADIGRHPHHRTRMAVVRAGGRRAVTHVEIVAEHRSGRPPVRKSGKLSKAGDLIVGELRVRLETGRTHQIRVHLAHIGHPVLGDPLYAAGHATLAAKLGDAARTALEGLGRQALHAAVLGFEHPVTGEALHFASEPPADLQALIDAVRST